MTHPYQRDRRIRRLEAYKRAQANHGPDPRYHDPRLEALTIEELEALEPWFAGHPGEGMPVATMDVIVADVREGVR